MFASFHFDLGRPVVATAIHNGHELREEIGSVIALDESTRLREEDAHTGQFVASFGNRVVAHRSRFEVDLNRPRDEAVYTSAEDAWGLELWRRALDGETAELSRKLHDAFYSELADHLDAIVERHGGFVLYDVHSYNHRRSGPDAPVDDPEANPQVNLGTGSLPDRWRPVADAFVTAMARARIGGQPVDVRENVKFRGREMASFVHRRYGEVAAALAIEFRKEYVDEWTDEIRPEILRDSIIALESTVDPVLAEWQRANGHR